MTRNVEFPDSLRVDAGADCPVEDLVTAVLCDSDMFDAQDAARLKTRFGLPLVPNDAPQGGRSAAL